MINEIAKKYGIKVIGDAAQSFGASINNQNVGSFADITTTSFFQQSHWGVMETVVRYLLVMKIYQIN